MKSLIRPLLDLVGDRIYCGLDIGAAHVKAAVLRVEDAETIRLLGAHEVPARGLADGAVQDIGACSAAVAAAVDGAARRARVRVRDVVLGLGGAFVDVRGARAVVPLAERGNKVIAPGDVRQARVQARLLGVRLEEEVLEDMVSRFAVDDVSVVMDPVGLSARKLDVEGFLVVIGSARLRNIQEAIRQAGYEVVETYFAPWAMAGAALDPRQRQDGTALVDIGARRTEVLVFRDGLLKRYQCILSGGADVTARLARELEVPFDLAEDLKRSYARVGDPVPPADEVLVRRDGGFVPVRRELICRVAGEEAAALALRVREALGDDVLASGIAVTGGGSLMTGMMELLEKTCGARVRVARHVPSLPNAPVLASVIALAETAYRGGLRYQFDSRKPADWVSLLRTRASELCGEYF